MIRLGSILEFNDGGFGIVVETGRRRMYSVRPIRRLPPPTKYAWWSLSEIKQVYI